MDTDSGLVDIVYRVCLMPHRTALNKLTLSWPGYNNKIMFIYLRNERTMGSAERVLYLEGQGSGWWWIKRATRDDATE